MPMQICPTTKAKLVSTMNLVNSRRPTYWSCGQSTGKSPRQEGCASGGRGVAVRRRCAGGIDRRRVSHGGVVSMGRVALVGVRGSLAR